MRRFLNNLSNELNQLGDQFQRQGAGGFPNPNNPQQQPYGYPPGSQPASQQQYGYPQQQQYGYQPPPPPQQYGYQPRPGQQPQQPLQYQPLPPQQQPQYGYQPTPSPQQQQVPPPQHQPPPVELPAQYQPPQPTTPHQQAHQPQYQSPHAPIELPAHAQPQPPPPQQRQAHQPQHIYQAPPVELPAQNPPRPVELPAQYQPPPQPQLQQNTSTTTSSFSSLANKLTKSLTSSSSPLTSSPYLTSGSATHHHHHLLLLSSGPSTCPRKTPQQNLTDWLSLPDPTQPQPQPGIPLLLLLPNFNICPACFARLIRPTAYARFFVPRNGSLIPGNPPVRCDLSRYWVRLAGAVLLAVPRLGHDIGLLPRIASLRTADGMDCPNRFLVGEGDALVVSSRKKWFGVVDPATGRPVRGFMVCESCAGNVSAILPAWRGGFVPLRRLGEGQQENTGISGSCALVPSDCYDDARTAEVLRELCACVAGGGVMFGSLTGSGGGCIGQFAAWLGGHPARPRGQAQTSEAGVGGFAVGLGSSYSSLSLGQGNGICPRHASPPGAPPPRGYTLQGFSELAVCEGCYSEVIGPDVEKGAGLALQFVMMTPSAVPGVFACQLYSDRMRRVWSDAVLAGEPGRQILMAKVSERRAKERELQLKTAALRQQAAQLRQQAELQEHLAANAMRVAANHASNNIMLHGVGARAPTGYGRDPWEARMNSGVPDFSQTTKLNNEAARLKMQAAQVESEIAVVGDEWRRFWE